MNKSTNEMVCFLLKHMTQQQIAEMIGISRQRVAQLKDDPNSTINSASFLNLLALYQRIERTVKRQAKKDEL
jgi:transcriptional regulator with XRE-family HTH domain